MFPMTEQQAYTLAAESTYKDLAACENQMEIIALVAHCQHHVLDDLEHGRISAPRILLTMMHLVMDCYILAQTESLTGQWLSTKRLLLRHFNLESRNLLQGIDSAYAQMEDSNRLSRASLN